MFYVNSKGLSTGNQGKLYGQRNQEKVREFLKFCQKSENHNFSGRFWPNCDNLLKFCRHDIVFPVNFKRWNQRKMVDSKGQVAEKPGDSSLQLHLL